MGLFLLGEKFPWSGTKIKWLWDFVTNTILLYYASVGFVWSIVTLLTKYCKVSSVYFDFELQMQLIKLVWKFVTIKNTDGVWMISDDGVGCNKSTIKEQ